jgi:hypothetical protein
MWVEKEEVTLSLFNDDLILYIENSDALTLLELINELSKVAEYKIDIWKLIVILYT